MKQTAVEWLQDEYKTSGLLIDTDFAKAKEIEKQQKKDAYEWGRVDEKNRHEDILAPQYSNADEFYAGEYGGDK